MMMMMNKMNQNRTLNLTFFILKGWMTKLGNKFKTWRYRYFELWSNGLLNYFENEMKLKKKGSLNIMDEVVSCDLYERHEDIQNNNNYWSMTNFFGGNNNKETQPINTPKKKIEYGFMIQTHDRRWYFTANKKQERDEWFLLIQTITFALSFCFVFLLYLI